MKNPDLLLFIENHILKRGEQLESLDSYSDSSQLLDFFIIKKTARTFRRLGMLTISRASMEWNSYSDWPENEMPDKSLLKWLPSKKAELQDDETTYDWLEKGWVMKEIRFKKDGRTMESSYYRMGFRLFQYQRKLVDKANDKLSQEFEHYKQAVRSECAALTYYSNTREKKLQPLVQMLFQLCDDTSSLSFLEMDHQFPQNWKLNKRLQFLTFILALINIAAHKEFYDWKEIGAAYFKKIGGSKSFDSYKDDFIALLEEWTSIPSAMLGLVSLGKVTPLYFSGQLTGQFSSYNWGPVHAVTDLSIAQEIYRTDAKILWLVENRAILTRIAHEDGFLFHTKSLLVCVDGHLRSSHKSFIHQILLHSSISQIMIWCDYDNAGLQIAEALYKEVTAFAVRTKWIRPDQRIETSWNNYQQYMEANLEETQIEQEQVLGSVEDWNMWISL